MAMHVGGIGGATSVATTAFPLTPSNGTAFVSVDNVTLVDDASGVLAQKNGATAQTYRVYGSNTAYTALSHDGTNGNLLAQTGVLLLGAANTNYFGLTTQELYPLTNNNTDIGDPTHAIRSGYFGTNVFATGAAITAGSGTGLTVNDTGTVRKVTHKVTVDYTALAAAATTADKTICTLPAKTRLTAIYADTTTKYIGGNISAVALKIGSTVGGAEVLASHDVFTAAVTKGLADADLGTSMVRAAAIQGGYMPSFTANTAISVRITTTSNNTNVLTQGSTTYYLETEKLQ
jgi:hypothetical protein